MDTDNTEQQQTEDATLASREELLAAVREAGGTESVDVAAEEAAAESPAAPKPAGEAAPAAPTGDPDEPRIAAVLRAREEAAKKRFEAEDYAAQRKREAEEEAARILAEAKKRAEEEWANEVAAKRRRFQESPTEAIRELAKDPQDIVDAVVKEGTPEWKMIRALQSELEATKAKTSEFDKVRSELESWRKEQEAEKQRAMVEQIRSQFLSEHASPEKLPYTYARYDSPEEVFEKANALAVQWQRSGLKLGVDFDRNDVAEYLEMQSKKKLSSLGIAPQQASGVAGKSAGSAPKVLANGSRTLSAATGSERRTSPKPIGEMTPEEERAALLEAVRDAKKTLRE